MWLLCSDVKKVCLLVWPRRSIKLMYFAFLMSLLLLQLLLLQLSILIWRGTVSWHMEKPTYINLYIVKLNVPNFKKIWIAYPFQKPWIIKRRFKAPISQGTFSNVNNENYSNRVRKLVFMSFIYCWIDQTEDFCSKYLLKFCNYSVSVTFIAKFCFHSKFFSG